MKKVSSFLIDKKLIETCSKKLKYGFRLQITLLNNAKPLDVET
jgi:hypothetical protein